MAGIGCAYPALAFFAVQRNRVSRQLLAPEGGFEIFAERLSLKTQFRGTAGMAERGCDLRGAEPGGVHVPLDLTQRDGTFGQRAVRVKNGILRILPTLLDEAFGRAAEIFDEAVPVGVAVAIDPTQCQLDVGPDGAQELEVADTLVVSRREHDEQRR